MRAVSSEEMATYLPRVESYARRFRGLSGAEFDDLVQEGWLKVYLLLREDQPVSNTAVKNAMRSWLRKCRRWYQARPAPLGDVAANEVGVDLPHAGRKTVHWMNDDGSPMVVRSSILDLDA